MKTLVATPINGGLTAQEEAYAQEFVRTRNQRAAYRAAYEVTSNNPVTLGRRAAEILDKPKVQRRIAQLIDAAAAPTVASVSWVLERLTKIATADPNEIMSVQPGACRYCHGVDHKYHWRLREYEEAMERADRANEEEAKLAAVTGRAPKDIPYPDPGGGFDFNGTRPPHADCPECDGVGVPRTIIHDTTMLSPEARLLFQGVKETANGIEIKMADQTKALELVGKIIGAFQDDSPKTLQVELKAVHAVMHAEAKTPIDAARMYQDMIAGRSK